MSSEAPTSWWEITENGGWAQWFSGVNEPTVTRQPKGGVSVPWFSTDDWALRPHP